MKKLLFLAILCTALVFYTHSNAAEQSSSFNFEVNTTSGCTIQGSPALNINYYAIQDEGTANATIQFACTPGTNYTFAVGAGSNPSAGRRRAVSGSDYVIYRLYWDSSYTDEILTDTNNTKPGTATGGTESRVIYAKCLKADNPTVQPGSYTDTVRITISW